MYKVYCTFTPQQNSQSATKCFELGCELVDQQFSNHFKHLKWKMTLLWCKFILEIYLQLYSEYQRST